MKTKGPNASKKATATAPSRTSKSTSSKSTSKKSKPQSNTSSQLKTKRPDPRATKKKQRTYTDDELGIPKLNTITPAGVQKPRGKKKGKVFVDDAESMLAIWSVVNAEKEGETESKIMKARQLEEIREAKRIEAERKQEAKREKLEDTKDSLRRKRKRKSDVTIDQPAESELPKTKPKPKKRVSFG